MTEVDLRSHRCFKCRLGFKDLAIFALQGQLWEEFGKGTVTGEGSWMCGSCGLQVSFSRYLLALEDLKIGVEGDRYQESSIIIPQKASHLISYLNLCWASGQQC